MRTMYDGIDSDAAVIPAGAQLVAGYVDGLYAWSQADWDRFPHSVHVRIAVHPGTNDGHVLDCEPGNCTPAQAVDWVLLRRAAGADPTVYCNEENPDYGWPAVRAAFQARGVVEPHYWVANYDGVQQIPAGAVAKQYENGERWDTSIVADYWPGIDPAPTRSDPHVVVLQELLNEEGARLAVDGVKGPLTKGAWLAVVERVGTLVEGDTGYDVKLLQAMLNTWWSYGWPQLAVDGGFGPLTRGGVEQFQVKRHVANSVVAGHGDGQVGPATKAALAV